MFSGNWPAVFDAAIAWGEHLLAVGRQDPRPQFARNVVHLLRGEFREAWQIHAAALQDPEDLRVVRQWVDEMLEHHRENPSVQLVAGLFMSQAGESEQSVDRYKETIRLAPRSPYAH